MSAITLINSQTGQTANGPVSAKLQSAQIQPFCTPVAALEGCLSIRSDAPILINPVWHKPKVRPTTYLDGASPLRVRSQGGIVK